MTYIQLINHFWSLNHRQPVGSAETALYLYILSQYNLARRSGNSVEIISALAAFETKISQRTLILKLKSLKNLGLIDAQWHKISGTYTITILALAGVKKGEKNSQKEAKEKNFVEKRQTSVPTTDSNSVPTTDSNSVPTTDSNSVPTTDSNSVPTTDSNSVPNSTPSLNKEYKEGKEDKEKEKKDFQKNLLDKECDASTRTREGDKKNEIEKNFFNTLRGDKSWIDLVRRQAKKETPAEVTALLTLFEMHCEIGGNSHRDLNDVKQHFRNWLKYQGPAPMPGATGKNPDQDWRREEFEFRKKMYERRHGAEIKIRPKGYYKETWD